MSAPDWMGGDLDSDAQRAIVAGLRAGHAAALDRAFDGFRPQVYSLLVRLTQDRALAEDLSQETFIRLARGAPTLAPDTRLGPWLLTVARNLAMDHFRWRRMHLALTNDHSIGSAFPRPASPFASAVTSQASRHVEVALAKLKPDERELLLRVSLDGCTPNELALDLGLSAEVVRKRLSRARGRLLELLEQS